MKVQSRDLKGTLPSGHKGILLSRPRHMLVGHLMGILRGISSPRPDIRRMDISSLPQGINTPHPDILLMGTSNLRRLTLHPGTNSPLMGTTRPSSRRTEVLLRQGSTRPASIRLSHRITATPTTGEVRATTSGPYPKSYEIRTGGWKNLAGLAFD